MTTSLQIHSLFLIRKLMIAILAGWANALQSDAIFRSFVLNSLLFVIAMILIILDRKYTIIHAEVNRNLIKIFDSPQASGFSVYSAISAVSNLFDQFNITVKSVLDSNYK